jgi:heme oxygenase
MAQVLWRECAAEAAAGAAEVSQPLQISATIHDAMLASTAVRALSKLSTRVVFCCLADHGCLGTSASNFA